MEEIHALKSPFVDTLIELYCQTRSLDRVKEKQLELEEAANKANLTTNITTPAIENPYLPHLEISNKASTLPDDRVVLRLIATQSQLNQVTDFMKAIGVQYEFV